MPHPALPRIETGLVAAQAALVQGDLGQAHAALFGTLDALAEVTREGLVPRQDRPPQPWHEESARQLVWQLLAQLHGEGCHVFPYAGTLLGLERDARLLPNDKDADFAVWLEDFSLAGRLLLQWGLQRATDVPPFANVATFVEPRTGYSVDLFGLHRNPALQRIEGGAWLVQRPPSHQRVLLLPWFDLEARTGPAGPVWWPAQPHRLLEAFYGDWRAPQPEWDSQISNRALQEVNLSWHCWALKALCHSWLAGDLARTCRLLEQALVRAGDEPHWLAWRDALDTGLRLLPPHRR